MSRVCMCVCMPFADICCRSSWTASFCVSFAAGMFVIVVKVPVTRLRCAWIGIYAEVCEQGKPEFKRAIQRKAGIFSFWELTLQQFMHYHAHACWFVQYKYIVINIYESWAKGPWKGFPLRKPLGMQLTVSAKVFFWNGERCFFLAKVLAKVHVHMSKFAL